MELGEHTRQDKPVPDCDCARCAIAERDRLRKILDCRPAINAGLPETYIAWTHGVYQADMAARVGYGG